MKSKLFLTILFLLVRLFSVAQDQETDTDKLKNKEKAYHNSVAKFLENNCSNCPKEGLIIYDFKCKEFFKIADSKLVAVSPKEMDVKYNKKLKFHLINVNRYVYDVGITADDVIFGSEPPNVFNQLFLGSGDVMTKLLEGLILHRDDGGPDPASKLKKSLEEFKKDLDELLEKQIEAYSICNDNIPCCDSPGRITTKFTELSKKLFTIKVEYLDVMTDLSKQITDHGKRVKAAEDKLGKDEAELKKKKDTLATISEARRKLPLQARIADLEAVINSDKTDLEKEKTILKSIEEVKSNLEKLFGNFTKITDEELMKLVLFNNNYLKEHFSYTSPPIYPQGNRLNISLGITGRDSSLIRKWNINPVYNDSISISFPVVNKTFLFFSSGPFLGLSKKTRNEVFGVQAQPDATGLVTDSTKYKIVSTGQSSKPIGICGLATYGWRVGRFGGIGITGGAGITIEPKPRPNYLAGFSFFAGDRQQFSITFGLNFVQIDKFKSELYSDINTTLYDTKPTIEYNRKSQVGTFLSLSYTVFTPSSSRQVKSNSNK